ncbi:MAG TPA: VOC family protein [Anaerolineae bacterium]|jgi:catechol 2,3-dioxygenase-like lactoylglutathione lyase family enzyme
MPIIGLDHIQLAMPPGGEAQARRFYRDLLGLIEVKKPEPLAARSGCWFEGQGTIVHLGVQKEFEPARKAHPAFLVSDLEHYRQVLEAGGAPIIPDNVLPNIRRFYTADPFGNRIELIQTGDGFTQHSQIASSAAP